jgi:hypothetical protein
MVSCNIGTNRAAANSGENPVAWHCGVCETKYAPTMPSPLAPIHKSHHLALKATPNRKEFQASARLAPMIKWDEARQIVEFKVMFHLLTAVPLIHQQMVAMFQAAQ